MKKRLVFRNTMRTRFVVSIVADDNCLVNSKSSLTVLVITLMKYESGNIKQFYSRILQNDHDESSPSQGSSVV